METLQNKEEVTDLTDTLGLSNYHPSSALVQLAKGDSRYLRDLKLNFKTSLTASNLTAKEAYLVALVVSVVQQNQVLINSFVVQLNELAVSPDQISEAIACASLLSSNNVLYRFRHFTGKDKYKQLPARLRMSVMMNPHLGKEFFELLSLAVSAVNGCEMCVNAHEHSLMELGTTEERVFDAIRIASVVTSLSKIIY